MAVEAKIRQYVLEVDVEELLKNCRMGVKLKGKRMAVAEEDGEEDTLHRKKTKN